MNCGEMKKIVVISSSPHKLYLTLEGILRNKGWKLYRSIFQYSRISFMSSIFLPMWKFANLESWTYLCHGLQLVNKADSFSFLCAENSLTFQVLNKFNQLTSRWGQLKLSTSYGNVLRIQKYFLLCYNVEELVLVTSLEMMTWIIINGSTLWIEYLST